MILRVVITAALAGALASIFVVRAARSMPDFEVYWRAGVRAAAAEPLYRAEDEHYQLKYLPAFAVLAVPLGWMPLPAAKAVWYALSVCLLGVVLVLSLWLLPAVRKRPWSLVLLTFLGMAKFYGHELVLGQVNLLFAAVVLAAVHLERSGRGLQAGLLVALAIVVKPYAVLFVPWLAGRRSVSAVAGAAAGIAAALALPAAVYGVPDTIGLHHAWWRTVSESTAPNLLNADNVSLAAMYAKWMGPGAAAASLAAASGIVLLAAAAYVVLRGGRLRAAAGLEAALLLTLIPLLSPQGWDYVFLIATPAVMYLINYERDLPAPARAAAIIALLTIAFSLYDVMGRQAYAAFMALSVISVCFVVLAGALVVLRVRGIA